MNSGGAPISRWNWDTERMERSGVSHGRMPWEGGDEIEEERLNDGVLESEAPAKEVDAAAEKVDAAAKEPEAPRAHRYMPLSSFGYLPLSTGSSWLAPPRTRCDTYEAERCFGSGSGSGHTPQVVADGWAHLPEDLLTTILEVAHAAARTQPTTNGWEFLQALANVRLTCNAWRDVHDALVTRLVLTRRTPDEAVAPLLRRFVEVRVEVVR